MKILALLILANACLHLSLSIVGTDAAKTASSDSQALAGGDYSTSTTPTATITNRRSNLKQAKQQTANQEFEQQSNLGQNLNQIPDSDSSQLSSPQQNQKQDIDSNNVTEDPLSDSEPAMYGSVAGSPGIDFPAYDKIPKTSFTCQDKNFDFGFYADEEAQCQVYHICWEGRRESFLCGIGTVFNQAILACDYWHSVDCSKSSQFYSINNELGKYLFHIYMYI